MLALQARDGPLQQLKQAVGAAARPGDDDAPADGRLVGDLEEGLPQGETRDVHLFDGLHRQVNGVEDGLDVLLRGPEVDLLLHRGIPQEEEGALLHADDHRGDPSHLQLLTELSGDPGRIRPLETGGALYLLRTHVS